MNSPENLFNHFSHFKVDGILQACFSKAKVLQGLHRKPKSCWYSFWMSSLPVLFTTFYLLILIFVLCWLDMKFYLPSLSAPLLARVVDDPIRSVVEPQRHNPVWWLWKIFSCRVQKIFRNRVQKNAGTLKNHVYPPPTELLLLKELPASIQKWEMVDVDPLSRCIDANAAP